MEFDEKLDFVPGKYPSFGAIFMSNSATMKECFRQKLFALPLGQADFVMQVKAGMILFVFEYESRQLYGVFRACSDGAMNIVPHAFSSSGKQFPAQVRFMPIWHCGPLSENEFREVIKENYFSANRFNFGLSERQVQKLLSLFNSRKLNKSHQREFIQTKVARPTGYSRNRVGTAGSDGSFGMSDGANDEQNAGGNFGSYISATYPGDSINGHARDIDDDKCSRPAVRNGSIVDRLQFLNEQFGDRLDTTGRVVFDDRFGTSDMVGNEGTMNMECRPIVITNYPGHPFRTTRTGPEIVNFATDYVPGHKHDVDNSFQPPISAEDHGFVQSSPPLYSVKPNLEANFMVNDQSPQSPLMSCSLNPQNSDLSFPTTCGDPEPRPIFMSTYPRCSFMASRRVPNDDSFVASYELGGVHMEDMGFGPPVLTEDPSLVHSDPYVYSLKPILEASSLVNDKYQQSPLVGRSLEPQDSDIFSPTSIVDGIQRTGGFYSVSCGNANVTRTLPYDKDVSNPSKGRSSSSGISDSAIEFPPFNNAFPSLGNQSFSSLGGPTETGGCPSIDTGLSTNAIRLSYLNDYYDSNRNNVLFPEVVCPKNLVRNSTGKEWANANTSCCCFRCSLSPQLEVDHRMLQHENNVPFHANVCVLKETNSAGSIDHHDKASTSADAHQNSETMYSGDLRRRVSVFSRITMPVEACEQDECKMNSSMEELMAMLHQSCQQWLKAKNVKRLAKRQILNSKASKTSKVSKDQLAHTSKEMNKNDVPAGEVNVAQIASGIPFLDFKRRSKMLKNLDDDDNRENENAGNTVLASGQHKKRRLIRPKFSLTESYDDLMVKCKATNTWDHKTNDKDTGSSGGRHKMRKLIKRKFIESESSRDIMETWKESECKISQKGELSDLMLPIGEEERNVDLESGSNFGGEKTGGSLVSFRNADEDRKVVLQDIGIQNLSSQGPFQVESNVKDQSFKRAEIDGLPQHCKNSNYSDLQESVSESFGEKSETETAVHGLDHDGGNAKLVQDVELVDRSCRMGVEVAMGSMMTIAMDGNPVSGGVSEESGNSEGNKQKLFLGSITGHGNSSFETASCCNNKISSDA